MTAVNFPGTPNPKKAELEKPAKWRGSLEPRADTCDVVYSRGYGTVLSVDIQT